MQLPLYEEAFPCLLNPETIWLAALNTNLITKSKTPDIKMLSPLEEDICPQFRRKVSTLKIKLYLNREHKKDKASRL